MWSIIISCITTHDMHISQLYVLHPFIECIHSTCPAGYIVDATCDGTCDLDNICLADDQYPCLNYGICTLIASPDQYSCNCTTHYNGTDCESMRKMLSQNCQIFIIL